MLVATDHRYVALKSAIVANHIHGDLPLFASNAKPTTKARPLKRGRLDFWSRPQAWYVRVSPSQRLPVPGSGQGRQGGQKHLGRPGTSVSEDELQLFGLETNASLVTLSRRLVCKKCGSKSVQTFRYIEDPDGAPIVPKG